MTRNSVTTALLFLATQIPIIYGSYMTITNQFDLINLIKYNIIYERLQWRLLGYMIVPGETVVQ